MTLCSTGSPGLQSTTFVSVTHMNNIQGPFYSMNTVHLQAVSRALCHVCVALTTAATQAVTDGSGSTLGSCFNVGYRKSLLEHFDLLLINQGEKFMLASKEKKKGVFSDNDGPESWFPIWLLNRFLRASSSPGSLAGS